MISKKLDQFYTNPSIAKKYFSILEEIVKKLSIKKIKYLEPSAGNGAFYNLLPKNSIGVK